MNEQSKELVTELRSVGLPREAQMDLMRQAAARIEYLERERTQAVDALRGALFYVPLGTLAYDRARDVCDRALSPATEGEVAK